MSGQECPRIGVWCGIQIGEGIYPDEGRRTTNAPTHTHGVIDLSTWRVDRPTRSRIRRAGELHDSQRPVDDVGIQKQGFGYGLTSGAQQGGRPPQVLNVLRVVRIHDSVIRHGSVLVGVRAR